ncbi:hypothetical protein [Georgenia sp. AZ-5]|uniref:hypothetical protein n=1 Tax=Georgenia sp. AZ-5 TaxID=3367526 RepID=UPI0037540CF0
MDRTHKDGPAALLPATRWMLVVFTALTLLGFLALFPAPDRTDETFAWTIAPPATAAFLGVGFLSGAVLDVLVLRRGRWGDARVPLATILVFTVITLVATLVHLDRFHLAAPGGLARFAAWLWLVVYVVVPVGMAAVMVAEARRTRRAEVPPARGPAGWPLPGWLRATLPAEGLVIGVVGALLFVAPANAERLWPWPLTPLTARAVAAWLLAYALATALVTAENDLRRLRTNAVAYTVFGGGQLVVALRFAGDVDWARPAGTGFLAAAAAVALTGAAGFLLARSAAREPAGQRRRRRA